jgi:hypothetical protein
MLVQTIRDFNVPSGWLLAGIGLRLVVAPFTYARDYWVFVRAAQNAVLDPQTIVTLQYWTYPPPQLLVLAILFQFWLLLPISHNLLISGNPLPSNLWYISPPAHTPIVDPILVLLLKIPSIAADLTIGLILLRILSAEPSTHARATVAFKAWMVNPIAIWISSASGHFDSIPTLFVVYALMTLLEQRNWRSSLSLGVGAAWKLWPLLLLPIFLIFQTGRESVSVVKKLPRITQSIIFALLPLIAITVFYFLIAGGNAFRVYAPSIQVTGYGLILGYIIPVEGLSYWLGGIPLTLTAMVLFILFAWSLRPKLSLESANGLLCAQLLLFLALSPVSAQYMMWVLPFLMIELFLHYDRAWLPLGLMGVILSSLVLGLDQFGFGFYFSYFIPQGVYDFLNSALVNEALVGTLRAIFGGFSFWFAFNTLFPDLFIRRSPLTEAGTPRQ